MQAHLESQVITKVLNIELIQFILNSSPLFTQRKHRDGKITKKAFVDEYISLYGYRRNTDIDLAEENCKLTFAALDSKKRGYIEFRVI